MLDLNLNVAASSESTQFDDSAVLFHDMDESGTSNSSIVNAADASSNDDSCSTRAINFNILKIGGGQNRNESGAVVVAEEEEEEEGEPMVTRELFPMKKGHGGDFENCEGQGQSSNSSSSKNWIDLSCGGVGGDGGGGGGEARVTQQASQPVKKSRRGPRSRSSQYRGVTFYRRTGRWESHIWYISIFSFPQFF